MSDHESDSHPKPRKAHRYIGLIFTVLLSFYNFAVLPNSDLPKKLRYIDAPEYASTTIPGRLVLFQKDVSHLAEFSERIELCRLEKNNELQNNEFYELLFKSTGTRFDPAKTQSSACDLTSTIVNLSLPQYFGDLQEIDSKYHEKHHKFREIIYGPKTKKPRTPSEENSPEYTSLLSDIYKTHVRYSENTQKKLSNQIYTWNIIFILVLLISIVFREATGRLILLPLKIALSLINGTRSTLKFIHKKI